MHTGNLGNYPATTGEIAAWENPTGAGVTFSPMETVLSSIYYQTHAVVVGELVPTAAKMGATFPTTYSKPLPSYLGLRKKVKWFAVKKGQPRCLIVRLMRSASNTFYVLTDKNEADGLCRLIPAPGQYTSSHYIAFYDEWVGDGDEGSAKSVRKAIKCRLDAFCERYRDDSKLAISKKLSQPSITPSVKNKPQVPVAPRTIEESANTGPQTQPQHDIEPSSNPLRNAKQPSPNQSQEQSQTASDGSNALSTSEESIDPPELEPQRGIEASNHSSQPVARAGPDDAGSQVQQETEQNSHSCQVPQDLLGESATSQASRLDTCLALLFAVDAEYTVSNAGDLLVEIKVSTSIRKPISSTNES